MGYFPLLAGHTIFLIFLGAVIVRESLSLVVKKTTHYKRCQSIGRVVSFGANKDNRSVIGITHDNDNDNNIISGQERQFKMITN